MKDKTVETLDILDTGSNHAKQQLLAQAASQENALQQSKENSLKLERALVTLWARMGEVFGSKWAGQFGTVDDHAFQTWLKFLGDLSPNHIRTGFEVLLRTRPQFAPDAIEFRKMCVGIAGLPDVREAYVEAANARKPYDAQKYSHPIVYHAGKACGFPYLAANPEKVALPRFKSFFELLVKRIERGDILEAPVPELLEHKRRPYNPEEHREGRERFLKQMQELGLTKTKEETAR